MSEADKMLDELGYIKYSEDEDKIIYKYDRETFRVSLTFDKRLFKKTFYATEGLWIANDDAWYTKKFKNEWDKYNASQGYWSNIWHEFDMQELQAINIKCKELRMELKKEWKEIRGYENKYIISNYGEIISLPRYKKNNSKLQYVEPKEILRYTNSTNGYVYVQLCKDGDCKNIRLHRLVAETFIPNPRNLPQVNHKDGNKENNCVNNLEWCTNQENVKHAYKMGLAKSKNKIKVNQYDLNGKFIKQYNSLTEASKQSRVSISKISTCINGKYKYKNKSKNKYIWKIGEEKI